jgi:hypothetical protein
MEDWRMSLPAERTKILQEIELIPDDRLSEIYDFLHHYRLGLEVAKEPAKSVMQYAGCWRDMPDEAFAAFTRDVVERRKRAFSGRRSRETSLD